MSSSTITLSLPHWNLDSIFPGLDSNALEAALEDHRNQIESLDQYLETHAIARTGQVPELESESADRLTSLIERMNAIAILHSTLSAYIGGHVSTDSFNTNASRRMSELEMVSVRFSQQGVRVRGWLGLLAESGVDLEKLISDHQSLQEHAFFLHEMVEESRYLMSEEEEDLASELSLPGALAWERLQGTLTSQIVVPFEKDGSIQELPIPALQNIRRYDPNETVRRRAFELEIKAW
jgi:oligoendopeptidase F